MPKNNTELSLLIEPDFDLSHRIIVSRRVHICREGLESLLNSPRLARTGRQTLVESLSEPRIDICQNLAKIVTGVTLEIIEKDPYCCQLPIKHRQTVLNLNCGTGELTINPKKLMIWDVFRRFLRIHV